MMSLVSSQTNLSTKMVIFPVFDCIFDAAALGRDVEFESLHVDRIDVHRCTKQAAQRGLKAKFLDGDQGLNPRFVEVGILFSEEF